MNIDPGELNERVSVAETVQIPDGMGGTMNAGGINHAVEGKIIGTVWAKVMPTRGKEEIDSGRVSSQTYFTFVVRADSKIRILRTHTLSWRGLIFNIRFLPPVATGDQYIFIEAESGVAY